MTMSRTICSLWNASITHSNTSQYQFYGCLVTLNRLLSELIVPCQYVQMFHLWTALFSNKKETVDTHILTLKMTRHIICVSLNFLRKPIYPSSFSWVFFTSFFTKLSFLEIEHRKRLVEYIIIRVDLMMLDSVVVSCNMVCKWSSTPT